MVAHVCLKGSGFGFRMKCKIKKNFWRDKNVSDLQGVERALFEGGFTLGLQGFTCCTGVMWFKRVGRE